MHGIRWGRSGLAAALLVAAAGCVGDEEIAEDGADDGFVVDGKADAWGIEEGTAGACGVLRLVNEADFAVLDDVVGLASNAAANLVAHRAGADGTLGTADDGWFDSLEELDDIRYIGPKSFTKLVLFADANGYTCSAVDVQILSVSDWHGQLDPVAATTGAIGGAAALSTWFRNDRQANPATLLLGGGDSFGASPPLSSFFEDRPTIASMNLMRFDADAVGNHQFDRGVEAFRARIEEAGFPFLAANLEHVRDNMTCESLPRDECIAPYRILFVGGLKVAVVGLVTTELPDVVAPGALGTIEVTDPIAAAQEAREQAAEDGAQLFVLVAHIGAAPGAAGAPPTGPLVELAQALEGFDLIIGGHTHLAVTTEVDGVPVVQTPSQGTSYSRIRLHFDFAQYRVTEHATEAVTPTTDAVAADPAIVELLAPFRTDLARVMDEPVGVADGLFERGNNVERLGEVALGDLLADAIRIRYGTQLAAVNGGGLRAPLPSSFAPANLSLRRPADGYLAGPPWDLVVGDAYAILPFGNSAVTRTITGTQLWAMCEHSVEGLPAPKGWFAQISGFRFTFDSAADPLRRLRTVTLADGTPIPQDETRYTLATVDFMDGGGDGYAMLAGSTDSILRDKMADVLLEHIRTLGSLTPALDGRIQDVHTP